MLEAVPKPQTVVTGPIGERVTDGEAGREGDTDGEAGREGVTDWLAGREAGTERLADVEPDTAALSLGVFDTDSEGVRDREGDCDQLEPKDREGERDGDTAPTPRDDDREGDGLADTLLAVHCT